MSVREHNDRQMPSLEKSNKGITFRSVRVGNHMNQRQCIAAISFALIATFAGVAEVRGVYSPSKLLGPYRTLIVGGGPDNEHNQAAIESNVRYVSRLLPAGSVSRVLYTDGNPDSKNVLCEDADRKTFYRVPEIRHIDGPAEIGQVKSEMAKIASSCSTNLDASALLYFTGHGSPNPDGLYENNFYDLWDHKELQVTDLAAALKGFPKQTPIALVMVECFSGAFGNVLFEGGDPKGPLLDQNICGFFASVAQRTAAGCTPEINEANYRDFTSYFFAALSGVDRLGKPVTGADYNHDGKVGMNEAFAYALIQDNSIDTPVCTSDVFLRRFVTTKDEDIVLTPYSQVESWAAPAQLASLTALTKYLDLSGEDRISAAYREFSRFMRRNPETSDPRAVHIIRFVRLAKSVVLAHTLRSGLDETLKRRFESLLKAESANPLR